LDCEICAGACCEELVIPMSSVRPPSADARRFIRLHVVEADGIVMEARCGELTEAGRCRTYSSRPRVCRDLKPGGEGCLGALARRRTPEQRARIRGDV
jgi:hypothetical protein